MENISLNVVSEESLPKSVTMSVSSIIGKDENKKVYVLFTDGKKMAELTSPGGNLMSNTGFSDEEIAKLREYVVCKSEYIFSLAKNVSPLKAFLGIKP